MDQSDFMKPIAQERTVRVRAQDQGSITIQLTSKETVRMVDDILRGYERDDDGNLLNEETASPVCTERFRKLAINVLTNALSMNVILSNLDQTEVDEQAHLIMEGIVDYIAMSPESLRESERDVVVAILDTQVYVALKRAFQGLERKTAREGQTEAYETKSVGTPAQGRAEEQKGFFSWLRRRT